MILTQGGRESGRLIRRGRLMLDSLIEVALFVAENTRIRCRIRGR